MIEVIRERVVATPNEETLEKLFSSLSLQYTPLLHSAFDRLFQLTQVSTDKKVQGELFVKDGSRYFYFLKDVDGLEAGSIGPSGASADHDAFLQIIMNSLGATAKRQPIKPLNKTYQALEHDFEPLSIVDEERRAASALLADALRGTLQEVKRLGHVQLDEPTEAVSLLYSTLEQHQLIRNEFLLFCRQTGTQIMMVESKDAILQASQQGFKCFTCGRSFSEEKSTQLVTITPFGEKLLTHQRWLTIAISDAIQSLAPDQRFSALLDDEVTDLLLNVGTSLVLIELSENDFQLHTAQFFLNKINLYKPAAAYLLTSSSLASSISKLLSQKVSDGILFSGNSPGNPIENFKGQFPKILNRATSEYVLNVLEPFTSLSRLPLEANLFKSLQLQTSPRLTPLEEPSIQTSEGVSQFLQPESPSPSLKNDLVRKISEKLSQGVTGQEASLQLLLQDLSNSERRWKPVLLTEDGLVIASTMTEETSEMLASYGSECFSSAQTFLTSQAAGMINFMTLASKNFVLELHPLSGLYLAIFAPLETTFLEASLTKTLAASSLEDAMTKVCDDLLLKDSILSAAFLTPQGEPRFEKSKEGGPTTLFPLAQGLFDNLKAPFEFLNFGPLEALALQLPTANLLFCETATGFLRCSGKPGETWDALLPYLLAISAETRQWTVAVNR